MGRVFLLWVINSNFMTQVKDKPTFQCLSYLRGCPKGLPRPRQGRKPQRRLSRGPQETTSPHGGPGGGAPNTGSPLPLEEPRCFHRFYYYFLRPTDSATEKMAYYSFQEEVARLRGGRGDGEAPVSEGRRRNCGQETFLWLQGG